jgi:2-polyprenyl-6-methoxyphenol hydroxylase-like FAD-dependent oxidoreductase
VGKYGEPLLSVFWQTLHAQLADAVGRGEIGMGKKCVEVVMLPEEGEGEGGTDTHTHTDTKGKGGRVRVCFEDGTSVRAQCVLAADGVHSGKRVCVCVCVCVFCFCLS